VNEQARRVVLEVIERHFGRVVDPRWVWREVAFGPCPRCRWPAHTLAPNGSPFHPFCWGNPDPVPSFDQWLRRKVQEGEWS
jgi:hypothetical protein